MSQGERVGTVLDNKYELVSLLGEGGMGAVYEAQHRLINRRLAVKFLHPQYANNDEVVTRFQREAQAAAKIGHENIIEITDMGTTEDDAPYIVMEYLEGTDVKGVLEQEGVQSVERTAHIMIQALSALQAAHDAHIIHRDLKPENIFLISKSSNPDYVKLLDFGISKFKELETDGQKALTQTGTVLGTPHYMSPEQARGEQNLTPRSDIYAMGVIMYQMLTGHLPFDAPNYNALLIKILTEDPPLPETLNPDLPEDIADTIKIAMARDPEERFVDCDEFKSRLVNYVPGMAESTGALNIVTHRTAAVRRTQTMTATPLEMTQSGISTRKSKLPLLLGAAAAVVLAAVIGIVAVMSGGGDEQPAEKVAEPPKPVVAQPEPTEKPKEMKQENQIELTVKAEPADAVITIDGATVGNPYSGYFVKSKVNRSIVVSAPGYQGVSEMVVFDKDLSLSYELEHEVVEENADDQKATKKRRPHRAKKETTPAVKEETPAAETKPSKKPRRKIDYADPWG
ncbi:MAG: serine/threonine protein kinase [Deltaproteobacteria bacterium]|nr:serine/threonine protein kinase [Deltaproteobacteria bacterium]MBN2671241.1 serine/threonine protein kinase [Deltaproteobacteria bacterium]